MPTSTGALTAEDVLGFVTDAVVTVLEPGARTLGRETAFADLDADSLALVEIADIVEERVALASEARLSVPDDDLAALRTIGDAVDYLVERLR